MGLLLAVFANQACLPVPSIAFLMVAGALARRGEMHAIIVVSLGVFACLVADGIWFWVGRRWGSKALRLLCGLTANPRKSFLDAQERFRRYGLRLLLVSKFVPGMDGIMPRLQALKECHPSGSWPSMQSEASSGWASSWEWAICSPSKWMRRLDGPSSLGPLSGSRLAFQASIWTGVDCFFRMIHRLRQRRISPPMLERKLKSDTKVALLDLLTFEEEADTDSGEAIPGAFSVDPDRLQKSPRITVPDEVEIILYSSLGSDIVSARAAMALKLIGIDNVRVLEGGLKAWREQGFPVSQVLEAPEVVAERLGVELPPA